MGKYVAIRFEEFAARMNQIGFEKLIVPESHEFLWERQVLNARTQRTYPYTVRIYSSIDQRSGVSRQVDTDAIRIILLDKSRPGQDGLGIPVMTKTVYRTRNALDNTVEAARDLFAYVIDENHHCPNCRHLLVVRKSRFGDFLGCVRYPDCQGKRKLEKADKPTRKPVNRPVRSLML